jgi:hypothetical protein
MIVHDCNPVDPKLVGREFRPNAWCGLTYAAFIDFCLSATGSAYFTVDCDYGVGVFFKRHGDGPPEFRTTRLSDKSRLDWFVAKANDYQRFAYFKAHRKRLLHLISPERFSEIIGGVEHQMEREAAVTDKPA